MCSQTDFLVPHIWIQWLRVFRRWIVEQPCNTAGMCHHWIEIVLRKVQGKGEKPEKMSCKLKDLAVVLLDRVIEARDVVFGRPHIAVHLCTIQLPVLAISTGRV
jgi:hypothetical protein